MERKKEYFLLVIILIVSTTIRFFNLMHDSPYFFNPDERNMANAISQLHLPAKFSEIPTCIINQFNQNQAANDQQPTTNCNLNPHFFAYGQFPLYLSFVSDQITKPFSNIIINTPTTNDQSLKTSFPSAIFWLRFWSALFSTLSVLFVYLITKELFKKINLPFSIIHFPLSIIAALMAAFSPGLIQSSHFGTTESLLTFFFLATVYLSLRYLSNLSNPKFVILVSLAIGISLGSKLTGIFFFIPPLISLIMKIFGYCLPRRRDTTTQGRRPWEWQALYGGVIGLLILIGSILIFILSSPYNLVEPADFKSAVFGYEQDVATGKYEAFYTRQFVNTTPILFQAEKIFPYALGLPVFVLGTAGFLLMFVPLINFVFLTIIKSIKYYVLRIRYKKVENKNILNTYYLILTTSFLFYLLPNAFLFAKWTRFMTPILPFFSIFAAYFLFVILGSPAWRDDSRISKWLKSKDSGQARMTVHFLYWVIGLLVIIGSITPGLAFMSIYTRKDTRVQASEWIYKNIPENSYILSETANVVDIPLGLPGNINTATKNYEVISFDFYNMDENPLLFAQLVTHLERANYIFIPSRRIFADYPKIPQKYPLVTKYYQLLFSGALGFEKITEISSFPNLTLNALRFTLPDESAEETFTVFDHPVVRIYRKIKPMTFEEYRVLFSQ